MRKNLSLEDEKNKDFLQIVNAIGGKNCQHWTQVARIHYARNGELVVKSYNLRKRYQVLTQFKENLTQEQEQILNETGIKYRGNGWPEFIRLTGCKMITRGSYSYRVGRFFLVSIRKLQHSFMHNLTLKKNTFNTAQRFSYVDVQAMLRACDVKYEIQDSIFQQLQKSAFQLEKLLYANINCSDETIGVRFDRYAKIVNRKDVKRILFFLEYCSQLIKLSKGLYKEESYVLHPLLKRNIESNKNTLCYQLLIYECDWKQKLDLFNSCSEIQVDDYSMLIKKTDNKKNEIENGEQEDKLKNYDLISQGAHKVCNKASRAKIKFIEQSKLKTFRGHYVQKGQMKTTGATTILFDHDVDSEDIENEGLEDEDKILQERLEKEKLQELFNCTFGKDDEAEQKKKKKKKLVETF